MNFTLKIILLFTGSLLAFALVSWRYYKTFTNFKKGIWHFIKPDVPSILQNKLGEDFRHSDGIKLSLFFAAVVFAVLVVVLKF